MFYCIGSWLKKSFCKLSHQLNISGIYSVNNKTAYRIIIKNIWYLIDIFWIRKNKSFTTSLLFLSKSLQKVIWVKCDKTYFKSFCVLWYSKLACPSLAKFYTLAYTVKTWLCGAPWVVHHYQILYKAGNVHYSKTR